MILVHGVDRFGRVDGVEGEYLVTRFHHVFLLPLVPVGSDWVMKQADGTLMGRPCRLSGRSVLAAYLRTWGLVMAAGYALSLMFVPAAIATLGSVASWRWRRMRDPRELRRMALQRAVFGSALDPARMIRADAAALVRPAEERLDEISGGRTAHDVARDGAVSAEEEARAFVALRLAAGARRAGAPEAFAGSERILDGALAGRADDDGPYRAQQPALVAATVAPPLVQPMILRPHRWHWFFATVLAWVALMTWLWPSFQVSFFGESYVDVAKAGVYKLANRAYPQWRQHHAAAPCPTIRQLAALGGNLKDPWGEEYRVRCYSVPFVGDGVVVWSKGEDKSDRTYDDIQSWNLY